MGAIEGTVKHQRRHEMLSDLALSKVLSEEPSSLLSVPVNPTEITKLFDALRRDQTTPPVVRKLLGRKHFGLSEGMAQALINESKARGCSLAILLAVLTRPKRVVPLPDGSWWLLGVMKDDVDSGNSEHQLLVGWLRLRLSKSAEVNPHNMVEEIDAYSVPQNLEAVRDELILVALQRGWKPSRPNSERFLVLLGPAAAAHIGSDINELEARAAVDNVHLTAVAIPRDISSPQWAGVRKQALEAEGRVFSAVFPDEQSSQRILATVARRPHSPRLVTSLPSPGPGGWGLETMIRQLQSVSALPGGNSFPLTGPRITSTVRFEKKEIYLAKTGSAPGFDVLLETGRRCPHDAWSQMRGGGKAPKKYKGVLRYLGKLDPPGQVLKAELCTSNGCGLVKVQYEFPILTVSEEGDLVETDPQGSTVTGARSPPVTVPKVS